MSSCSTVAREKCTLLPRRLISFCSCVIVSVGNETETTSPPVKKGVCSWRSGDIISIRQDSLHSGGTGSAQAARRARRGRA